jgi:hypothetical protein
MACGLGCVHGVHGSRSEKVDFWKAARTLERDFVAIVEEPIITQVGYFDTGYAQEVAGRIGRSRAELEGLRHRYLRLFKVAENDVQRSLCLTRLAEMHLGLAARIRTVPVPTDGDEGDRERFTAALVQQALPLEAIAHGLLNQVVLVSEKSGRQNRFTRRARVYLALHFEAEKRNLPNGIFRRSWRKGEDALAFSAPALLTRPLAVGGIRGDGRTAKARNASSDRE